MIMRTRPDRWVIAAVLALAVCAPVPTRALTPDQWRTDIAQARSALGEKHPDFFARLDRDAFETALQALGRDLPRLSDPEVVVRLAEIVAAGRDGHTRLTLPLAPEAGLFRTHRETSAPNVALFGQFPLRLQHAADGFVVVQAAPAHRDLLGARLVAIGETEIEAAEARLLPVIHGDNIHQQRELAASFLVIPEILAARGLIADPAGGTWRFQLSDGAERSVRLDRLGPSEAVEWTSLHPGPEAGPLSLKRTAGGVLHVRIAEVVEPAPGGFADFAARLEAELAAAPPRAVLIDLRGDIGGDNSLIDPLVRVLVRARSLWEPGRLFVATDGGTFSAAVTLSSALERWTPAVFVGAPTGGAPNGHGDAQRVKLPESGLTLRVSSLYWQTTGPRDEREAIAPLIAASPKIAQIRRGDDPVLEAIQSWTQPATPVREGRWRGRVAIGHVVPEVELVLGDEPLFDVKGIGAPASALRNPRVEDGVLLADVEFAGFPGVVRARFSQPGLIGHLELRGRYYPFIASRP